MDAICLRHNQKLKKIPATKLKPETFKKIQFFATVNFSIFAKYLTSMLDKIQPAVEAVQNVEGEKNSKNLPYVNEVARVNVLHAMEKIRKESPVLNEMLENGEIGIVGAMYNVSTGAVDFCDIPSEV